MEIWILLSTLASSKVSDLSQSIHAIVTGTSRGLGHALAHALLERDISVHAVARNRDDALQEHAESKGVILHQLQADLSKPQAAEHTARELAEGIPAGTQQCLLINNAGTVQPVHNTADLLNAHDVTASLTLNVTSIMMLCGAVLNKLRDTDVDCRILNISSGAGRAPVPGWGVYCTSKAAVDMYTQVLAAEHPGVRAVSMAPGVIDTAMQSTIRDTDEQAFPNRSRFIELHRSGQLASPDDIARRLIDCLLANDFGQTIIDDVRHHP